MYTDKKNIQSKHVKKIRDRDFASRDQELRDIEVRAIECHLYLSSGCQSRFFSRDN